MKILFQYLAITNESTILTKNGELLQTIEINRIHSKKMSKDLFNLRAVVRKSIIESIDYTKFATIMSIKEYQEVLDRFLQIPVEMLVTEVFNFIDKKEVVPKFEDQNYILGVSGD